MHLHLPKPLHGWRALVGEVGIIVIGVLIALGAEQMVEGWHHRAELGSAEAAMTSELVDDDLPQAFARAAIVKCYSDQLDAIQKAVASGDRADVVRNATAYAPLLRTWDKAAYESAVASQVLVPAGSQRMLRWANIYNAVPFLDRINEQEHSDLPQLSAPLSGNGQLSPNQQDRLFQTINRLRQDNGLMVLGSVAFIHVAQSRGIDLPENTRVKILTGARAKFGACVRVPTPELLNMSDQFADSNKATGAK